MFKNLYYALNKVPFVFAVSLMSILTILFIATSGCQEEPQVMTQAGEIAQAGNDADQENDNGEDFLDFEAEPLPEPDTENDELDPIDDGAEIDEPFQPSLQCPECRERIEISLSVFAEAENNGEADADFEQQEDALEFKNIGSAESIQPAFECAECENIIAIELSETEDAPETDFNDDEIDDFPQPESPTEEIEEPEDDTNSDEEHIPLDDLLD